MGRKTRAYMGRGTDPACFRPSGPFLSASHGMVLQVVSDYLTGYDDPGLLMRAGSKPVTMYTYRMAFWRAAQ
jgi:hypothetical protein